MRLRAALACVVCLAAASSCGDSLAPVPAEGAPAAFTYETVGFLAEYTTVTLDGGALVIEKTGYGSGNVPFRTETRRTPSAAEWRAFWAAVDEADVRRWPAKCGDNAEADGGGFRFALAWDDARAEGSHVNGWPLRTGACTAAYSDEARRFEAAVAAIAGLGSPGGMARP